MTVEEMTLEEMTDMLNEIQFIVDKYGYDIGGYNTNVNENIPFDMFEILLLRQIKYDENDKERY